MLHRFQHRAVIARATAAPISAGLINTISPEIFSAPGDDTGGSAVGFYAATAFFGRISFAGIPLHHHFSG